LPSPEIIHSIVSGVETTLLVTVLSALVALVMAFIGGLGRISPSRFIRFIAGVYVEVFRGTSMVVQLFWIFFVLPTLGVKLSPIEVGVLVFGLNVGAYSSEIVKGAVRAIPRAQWEAAIALNMSRTLRMRRIILPQAIPTMLPSFGNQLVDILKATSLLSLINAGDITRQVSQLIVEGTLPFTKGYSLLLLIYFVLAMPLVAVIKRAESRGRRRFVAR
jgi:polar amino acid transport system permease protein